jgi:amino acid transporter
MAMHGSEAAERDAQDLARFGYRQELRRTLGVFSSFAVAFSYISPSTGIFALFFLGLTTIGGIFFWSWPIVAAGQLIIALSFAELSSHYPVAGSVFQWTKYLSGRTYSWFTGWIYLFAGILTVASVCVTLPLALIPALNGMGWDMAALFHNHQGVNVIFDSGGTDVSLSTFLVAMFMSLYVIYGFDTASTLAEETKDPRREAPRAVIGSVIGAFLIGIVFLWATLMAIPDMKTAIDESWGPAQIIDANFSNAFATTYLLVVAAAIFVCCLSIQASTIRLCFGMARDERLPASKPLAKVHPRLHTPIWTCIAIGVLAFIPMIQFAGAAVVAIAATGMIYLTYFVCNLAVMRARLKGWPRTPAPFSLGKWGIPISIAGLVYGGAMLVNIAWPRAATNPTPNETGKLLNFHWNWLNDQPVFWTVVIAVTIVGAIYFVLVQRKKAAFLTAPEGEVFAEEAPSTPATPASA